MEGILNFIIIERQIHMQIFGRCAKLSNSNFSICTFDSDVIHSIPSSVSRQSNEGEVMW